MKVVGSAQSRALGSNRCSASKAAWLIPISPLPTTSAGMTCTRRCWPLRWLTSQSKVTSTLNGTSPVQLRALADWLVEREVDEVVMESTAQYWRPVWEPLLGVGHKTEGQFLRDQALHQTFRVREVSLPPAGGPI